MRRAVATATGVVLAATFSGCQRSEAALPTITTTMYVVNHRPVVHARVVGPNGASRALQLLVDTAGTGVAVNRTAARRVGLDVGDRDRDADGVFAQTEIGALYLGSHRLDFGDADARVALDSDDASLEGVDGAIGADVLSRYGRVTLNFPAGRLVLGAAAADARLGNLVPTTADDDRFTARIDIEGDRQRMLVDSGSVTSYLRERATIRMTGTRRGRWGRVALAPFEVVSDPDTPRVGVLGGNLLERYTLRIDYTRHTIRISTT